MKYFVKNLSIRARLNLIISGVLCLAMAAVSVAVYSSVVSTLDTEINKDLASRAQELSHYIASANSFTDQDLQELAYTLGGFKITPVPSSSSGSPLGLNIQNSGQLLQNKNDLATYLSYIQILDPQGNVRKAVPEVRILNQPDNQRLLSQLIIKPGEFGTVVLSPNRERVRIYTEPIFQHGTLVGFVQTARSLQEIQTITGSLIIPFVIGAGLTVFVLAVFSWRVTNKAFAPIENITNTAYRIGVNNDLAERIWVNPDTNDEVSRLGLAFNKMLDRIENEFYAQRQFIADSSHELRTPLTVIRGNLDLLKRNPDPKNQAESLRAIERESTRMQRMVQDLLLLAQADSRRAVEFSPLMLDEIVLDVFEQGKLLANARNQTIKLGHFDAVQVIGDADQLKRVFLNLVENATKYTPENGNITISLYAGKRWTRVVVADTGVGIDQKDQSLIFNRFYRVDKARSRNSGGSGLGLAIVKHIVEAHRGRINLESEQGKGTDFIIWLPLEPNGISDPGDDENEEVSVNTQATAM